jgi:streptomycin 6-kinase
VEVVIPAQLADHAEERCRSGWLASLPAAIESCRRRWSLEVGAPFEPDGQTAWVAPARSPEHGEVVLKVACRHDEALDEAKGLREWNGDGAVMMVAEAEVDETTTALLLERCEPGTALSALPGTVQDEVLAGLLARLWRPPPFSEGFRPLQQMCDLWADECEEKLARRAGTADAGLLSEGIERFRSLPASADRDVLLCPDLHADNVLAARREPWLAIDPKPYVGDPTYDVVQHLLNCEDRLMTDPTALVARVAGLSGLDPDRLRLWLFARCVVDSPRRPELLEVARRLRPSSSR